jgi:hypothetical protein
MFAIDHSASVSPEARAEDRSVHFGKPSSCGRKSRGRRGICGHCVPVDSAGERADASSFVARRTFSKCDGHRASARIRSSPAAGGNASPNRFAQRRE